jgi:hypothetical protein
MFLSLSLFFTLLDVTLSVRPNVGLVDLKAPAGGLDLPVCLSTNDIRCYPLVIQTDQLCSSGCDVAWYGGLLLRAIALSWCLEEND